MHNPLFTVVYCEGDNSLPFILEFSDLHQTENLKTAKDSLFNQCGIYCFKCLETGAIYIGSSTNLGNRLVAHIFDYSSNLHLQNAILKYGLSCFVFYVVEFCNPAELLQREQYYLNWLFSLPTSLKYNFLPTAGSRLGSTTSEETKAKMSEAQSGTNHYFYGKHHSTETKAKLSAAKRGAINPNYGVTSVNAVSVTVYSLENQPVQVFTTQIAAAKWLKVHPKTVYRYIKSGRLLNGMYYLRITQS